VRGVEWKTYVSPEGPNRTLQERTKKQGSRVDMFSPSGIESCGSEPAKAKKITSRKKSADSSSSFSEDPKMIFPLSETERLKNHHKDTKHQSDRR